MEHRRSLWESPDLRRVASAGLWTLTTIAACVLGARSFAGEFDTLVHGLVPVLATALALTASLTAWWFDRWDGGSASHEHRLVTGMMSLVAPAIIAYSTTGLSSPLALGVSTGLLVLAVTIVLVHEGVRVNAPIEIAQGVTECGHVFDAVSHEVTGFEVPRDSLSETDSAVDEKPGLDVIQHVTRREEADGRVTLEAELVATFAAGARETAVHLPLHPVLPTMPHVECEPLDDSDVTTRVTAALPYGVRIEVRRTGSLNEPRTVPIGITVSAERQRADVA